MHFASYTIADAPKMLAHYTREIGERNHIDPDGKIYDLRKSVIPPYEQFQSLIQDLVIDGRSKPLADIVLTMPEGYDGDVTELFESAYKIFCSRVGGEDNVITAMVHLDEPNARPHMHFAFVPVVDVPVMTNDKSRPKRYTKRDEKKNPTHKAGAVKKDKQGRVLYERIPKVEDGKPVVRHTAVLSKMFSQEDMRNMHPQLEKTLCTLLHRDHVGIMLDEDDPLRALSHLDQASYKKAKDAMKAVDKDIDKQKSKLDKWSKKAKKLSKSMTSLASKNETLKQSKAALQKQKDSLEKTYNNLNQAVQDLKQKEAELQEESKTLNQAVQDLKQTTNDLNLKQASYEPDEELKRLQQQKANLEATSETLNQAVSALQAELTNYSSLEDELATLSS